MYCKGNIDIVNNHNKTSFTACEPITQRTHQYVSSRSHVVCILNLTAYDAKLAYLVTK